VEADEVGACNIQTTLHFEEDYTMSFQTDVDSLFNEPFRSFVCDLYGCWLDEMEDINEYGKILMKLLPPKITMVRMTERPFGFTFTHQDRPECEFAFFVKSNSFVWKRTK